MPNLFGPRRPQTTSSAFPDLTTPLFDPFAQPAPPEAPGGALSDALGEETAYPINPWSGGAKRGTYPGSVVPKTGLLELLKELLGTAGIGGKGRSSQVAFADEMPSKPWGVRYDTPSTRDFGGGSARSGSTASRGFASESGREG